MYDIIVIGCGVIGASVAYELSKYNLKVLVLEKEIDVADGTTKANSGILHSGYDPEPGTLMAKLNVEGSKRIKELVKKLDVQYNECGSLVLAFNKEDEKTLEKLLDNGIKNGVENLRIIDKEEVEKLEPNINKTVTKALYSPGAGVIDPWELCIAMSQVAVSNGIEIKLNSEVVDIIKEDEKFIIKTDDNTYTSKYIVNAAGINSDKVHNMVCEKEFEIKPSKGQYFILDKSQKDLVKHVLFQCPSKLGKGVLIAPTSHTNIIIGPNAESNSKISDKSTTFEGLNEVKEKISKTISDVPYWENINNFSGLRANSTESDFIIREAKSCKNFIDLAGIKSPGLASCAAIGLMCLDILRNIGVDFVEKENYIDSRKIIRIKHLSPEERAEKIKENPLYGNIICRCITVSEGEIIDSLKMPLPPRTLGAVKKRTGAGMGRCLGGFCGPKVLDIISRELDIKPEEVYNTNFGSYIITGKTKEGDQYV
ncbi:FAD-dependent oxidoreductase [Parvimonas micra]